ncbi:MAG: DUF4386 domain-containing protein [Thermoplasmata archaeon]|nr:MAG: DUF4386 domain-containing protein [Thermoplasmata archaeon]
MNIAMMLSGFLFLLIIIVLTLATSRFGYEIYSDLDSEALLQKINKDPKKFRIGVKLVIFEHIIIITLAIMMFIAFNSYNIILAVVWTISRAGEGTIQIYNKKSYFGLINLAKQYSGSSGAVKKGLIDNGLSILKSKNSVFSFAQILFSIGTLSYCILFIIYEVVPPIIGWLGLVAALIYLFGNGIRFVKPNFNALWNLGGLLIWIFELVLGGWLLFYPLF